MTLAFKARGRGRSCWSAKRSGWLGQSLYLREICGREEGAPPPVDLAAERRARRIRARPDPRRLATAVHDVSDGGLLVALAEMAMASGIGAVLEAPPGVRRHAFWFGEDQARYVVTAKNADAVVQRASAAAVPVVRLGATGGNVLAVAGERPLPVKDLRARFEAWLPAYMAAPA